MVNENNYEHCRMTFQSIRWASGGTTMSGRISSTFYDRRLKPVSMIPSPIPSPFTEPSYNHKSRSCNTMTTRSVRLQKTKLRSICDCHDHDYAPWMGEIHGMSQALMSKSLPLRLFWCAVLALCIICGTATTVLVVLEYMRGPTATSTTIRLVPTMELPAITVCPKIPDALNFEELYHDMRISLPNLTKSTAMNLIRFWLGGSGLENMDELPEFNKSYLSYIAGLYDLWSAGYDPQSFFDLKQEKYGYKCTDLFHYCELGGRSRDCCKSLFHRRAVMRRGLCYQTRRGVNQTEADDIGRLVLSIKAPPSVTSPQYNFIQPQIVIYINDNYNHVLDFPRFYLYAHEWNRMHFSARLVELLEHPSDCISNHVGKDANCFVQNWLTANVIQPYNCTVPYLRSLPGIPPLPACRPYVIAKEYYNAIQLVYSGSVHSHACIPGCTRWEYGITLQQSPSLTPFVGHVFNLEASFYDLQYEHVKEVFTISVSGFMSQIGGQFGFFLGLSIITVIQIVIHFVSAMSRKCYKLLRKSFISIYELFCFACTYSGGFTSHRNYPLHTINIRENHDNNRGDTQSRNASMRNDSNNNSNNSMHGAENIAFSFSPLSTPISTLQRPRKHGIIGSRPSTEFGIPMSDYPVCTSTDRLSSTGVAARAAYRLAGGRNSRAINETPEMSRVSSLNEVSCNEPANCSEIGYKASKSRHKLESSQTISRPPLI